MKKIIAVILLICLAGFGFFLSKNQSTRLNMDVTARFDGYAQRATPDYQITIPVIRPTERYAFISDLHFLNTNWPGADSTPALSIAIGNPDLRTSDGNPLEKGRYYRFVFRQKLLDSKDRYSLEIRNSAGQSTVKNP